MESYYKNWEKDKRQIGKIGFINARRAHPCRKAFADWVENSNGIKSILEAGPGEMIEYSLLKKKGLDIDYSIVDVSGLFIDNCKEKYPEVKTYRMPLEKINGIKKKQFDCVYQCSVFEHSSDIKSAIKNFMNLGKNFHFTFFKWSYSGGLKENYNKAKDVYSSYFNIYKIFEEICKYGEIESKQVCMNKTKELVDFDEFSKGKSGKWRSGDYLMVKGKTQ